MSGFAGRRHTPEAKAKCSEARRSQPISVNTRIALERGREERIRQLQMAKPPESVSDVGNCGCGATVWRAPVESTFQCSLCRAARVEAIIADRQMVRAA